MNERDERIAVIARQLETLSDREINHIQHVLNALEAAKKENSLHYLGKFLGINLNHEDGPVMELGLHNENIYGVAQGGALYVFADVSIGFTVLKEVQEGEKVFTLELKVNFIKKGEGSRLVAKPRILHFGKTTAVADCTILDDNERIVAQALGTFYIVK